MPLSTAEYRVRPVQLEGGKIRMDIVDREEDDENAQVVASFGADLAELNDEMRLNVLRRGGIAVLAERTSDVTFGGKKTHTPEEKIAAYSAVWDQLKAGQWERERKPLSPVVSCEVEALAELTQSSIPEIQATLRTYSKEDREATLANPEVQAKAKEVKARRDAKEAQPVDLSRFQKKAG